MRSDTKLGDRPGPGSGRIARFIRENTYEIYAIEAERKRYNGLSIPEFLLKLRRLE